MLLDWKACKDVKEALCRCLFKKNQIEALVPNNKKKRLTIKKRAQYCAKTKDVWDIWLHALDLAVPKNNTDKAIVAASSCISQFHRELAEAGVGSEQIYIYAKLLKEGLRRIQNINTTKISTMQDLADIIMMSSIRPAEVATLCIIYYEPGEAKNNPKSQQFISIEKNPECAKELLTWIQDAIATKKLCNPVYSINRKHSTGVFSKFLKSYSITAKRLRKIGGKHACKVYNSSNPTHQHLDLFNRIALRHKIVCLDAKKNYAIGNIESEDSDLESESDQAPSPIFESQAVSSQPKNNNSNSFES
ncbi:3769_t:CDS:2 [Cetraspora pellucida]|uniref:3769_t:CDS:1 n=1 Tax=Cetraspora pellucida TaxID=1433469 RepID=A0A9N9JL05_9GLOM|nr:3769_t:CDS:2 [Cetraspora pellucida]